MDANLTPNEYELHRGPQEGAKVRGLSIPSVLYTTPCPNEDGAIPWSRKPNKQFPIEYVFQDGKFCFTRDTRMPQNKKRK